MNDVLTLISNIALTLSFLVALVFGVVQVKAVERDRRERFAIEALRNFQTREFAELIHYITSQNMPTTVKELRDLSPNDQVIFVQLSQQMEALGLSVAGKFVSIQLVERTLGSFVTLAWKKYRPIFMSLREQDPFIGEYFQWLAEHIEEWMRENPRDPFYKTAQRQRELAESGNKE